jgi:diguanylate cyclase (GGDEF)-like protein
VIALCGLVVASVLVQLRSLVTALPTAPAALWLLVALAITVAVAVDAPLLRIPGWGDSWVMTSMTFSYANTYFLGHGAGRTTQAIAVALASVLARRGRWRMLFDIGRYCTALVVSATVAGALGRVPVSQSDPAGLVNAFLAAAAWYVAFRLATATGTWLDDGGRWTQALRRGLPVEAVAAAALLCLGILLLGLANGNAWLIPLVVVPLLAVTSMSYLYWQQAMRDSTTGLPSRLALEQSVGEPIHRMAEGRPGAGMAALLDIDVVQLGRINDALGHTLGDEVLVAVGRRLACLAGPHTAVARLHGDEFAMFVWPVATSDEVVTRARNVRALFDEPLSVGGFPVLSAVSVGVALCPAHATNFEVLLRYADTAMEQAKGLPSRLAIFQPSQEVATAEQLALLNDLDRALAEPGTTQIVPFYQPQVEMASGRVVGAEALLRWRHPTRGMVSPEQVMRAAEQTPIMRKISTSMIDQVLAQLAIWQSDGLQVEVSVNVSVRDLYSTEFVEWLDEQLAYHGVDPSRMKVELTETALVNQAASVLDSLTALRRIGIGTSLDDFGTGFSSLQHLQRLPLTELKIDKSFVQAMLGHREEESIVRAVIEMGSELGLRVVAEGVEDEETKTRLLEVGCPVAQGWYYAAPLPADEFGQWCRHHAVHT